MKLFMTLFISLLSVSAFAVGPSLTYHGRILKSDGNPLTASNVLFKIQIRSPGIENCLLYEESLTKNLATTDGAFAISINAGQGTRTDSSGISFEKIFSNRVAFTVPTGSCSSGTTYTPGTYDGRSLLVYFNDGTFAGWEAVPQQAINLAPQAIDSLQVGGFNSNSLLRVANGSGPQSVSALTTTNYSDLVDLLDGTSTKYMQNAGGTQSPVLTAPPSSPTAGQIWYDPNDNKFKYFNGSTTTVVGSDGTVTSTVDVAHGGTGATSLTQNAILLGNGTSPVATLSTGTSGQVLRSNGTSAPSWTSATYPSSVTSQALLFGSSTNIVGEVTVPSLPSVLMSTPVTGAPQWSTGGANTFLKGSASGVSFSDVNLGSADVSGTLPVSKGGTGATSLAGTFVLSGGQDGALTLGTNNSNNLTLKTNNATAMTIDNVGKVGVAVSTPKTTLDVNGQIKSGFVAHSSLNTNWATGNIQSTSASAGTLTFTAGSMFDGTSYTLILTSTGNYVLGTNTDITSWRCLPACSNATIAASGHTVLTIIKAGTTGYVSWLAGF